MLTSGRSPFEAKSAAEVLSAILKEDPPELPRQVPPALETVVRRCLEKRPEERFQSARDLTFALQAVSGARARFPLWPKARVASLIASAAVVALIAGYAILTREPPPAGPPTSTAEPKGIVVLPFENLGPPEQEYFASGISEEITSRLAAVHELKVISRKSAVHYARTDKPLKEIGVDYVLEGSVRWAGEATSTSRVRVTPQLIRVSDDTHMWSESYDRELSDIFEVQSEIGGQIVHQLGITLLEGEELALQDCPTENPEAYQAYLRGLDYDSQDLGFPNNVLMAVEMFERAVKLDPKFVLAYAQLSRVQAAPYFTEVGPKEERRIQSKQALRKVLAPDSTRARLAVAYYDYLLKNRACFTLHPTPIAPLHA